MSTWQDVIDGKARWAVVNGDCLDVMAQMPDKCVAHVITDPPYGTGAYKTDVDVDASRVFRLATGNVALFGYPELLVDWCRRYERTPDEWVTWWPSNADAKAGGRWKALPKSTECVAIFGTHVHAKRITRARSRAGLSGKQLTDAARMGDVWTDPAPGIAFNSSKRLHPNEKPVELLMRLVDLCSEPGDIVLDPFSGSFSMGVACMRMGRGFIGIEKSSQWAELGAERLEAETAHTTLQAARSGQLPMFGGLP